MSSTTSAAYGVSSLAAVGVSKWLTTDELGDLDATAQGELAPAVSREFSDASVWTIDETGALPGIFTRCVRPGCRGLALDDSVRSRRKRQTEREYSSPKLQTRARNGLHSNGSVRVR